MTSFVAGQPPAGSTAAEGTSFTAAGVAPEADPTADQTVVFEHAGRKFTKADLAKKLDAADNFIETLKSENSENRKALDAATKALQENINAVDILKQIKQNGAVQPATGAEPPVATVPVTVDQVVQQLEQRQQKQATDAQRKTNWTEVTHALTKAFGATTDQKVAQVAAENGMTLEQAAAMARETPKAFLKLFPDLSKRPAPSALPGSGKVNSQAFTQSSSSGPSGYAKATNTRDLVTIYQQKLAEVASRAAQ